MDSLEVFFSVINHPVKILILKFMGEHKNIPVSFEELMDIFLINRLPQNRTILISCIWEMHNDCLLLKTQNQTSIEYRLTKQARELNEIIIDFDYWLESHPFYGGI